MTDERQDVLGADEDPTLETATSKASDEDPTLDNTTEGIVVGLAADATHETETPKPKGWAARLEHMAAAKKERRRLVLTRVWLAAVPVLVLVVVGVVLLAVYGRAGGGAVAPTTTTSPRPAVEGSGLMLVQEHGSLTWVVILQPLDGGGVVLAVPGSTLLVAEAAFRTLAEIYQADGRTGVKSALADALDLPLGPAVSVEWSDLQGAMKATGTEPLSVEAVQTLVGGYRSDGSTSPWDKVRIDGDATEFRQALLLDAESMTQEVWKAEVLNGTAVQGEGFSYLEPDMVSARALLLEAVQGVKVSVEIKDGGGVEGAARQAGALLESAGFVLRPMGYADGYPGVQKTQISASADAAAKAQQVRSILGVGEIVADKTLGPDRIVVILGKDIATGSTGKTEGTE